MHPATILIIAVALSMDAFAVSVASGLAMERLHVRHAIKIATSFGLFQAIMPIIGWLAGVGLRGFISGVDHWIAFALLAGVGGKMIYESRQIKDEEAPECMSLLKLLVLSVATSIDALAVGLSLSLLKVAIVWPSIVIGIVTFVFSFAGVYIGRKVGHLFESTIEIAGGLILIAIGIKILVEHLG